MKRFFYVIGWLILTYFFTFGNAEICAFSNQYKFTVPSRGIKYYEVNVPEGATKIKAVITGQTQMLNLALYGPGENVPLCKASTWSHLSNWKAPLNCGVDIIPKRRGQGPGIWKVRLEGSVHKGKLHRIKSVSGVLTISVQ